MENIEILKNIVLEDGIENISFSDKTFTIKLGDILNTETETGNQYYLLDSYLEVPYDFSPTNIKFHRGIVNEFECNSDNDYKYSGFVHYSGSAFCYGESGIEYICNLIRDEGLDSDKFNMLLIKFNIYLSTSSHGTQSSYRKLDLLNDEKTISYKLIDVIEIDGKKYPSKILEIEENITVEKVLYEKPYIEIIKEFNDKAFKYNNETIIPKVVRHEVIKEEKTIQTEIKVDVGEILKLIKEEQIKKLRDEINNKERITFQNIIHKFPDKFNRVDGSLYI